MPSIFGPLFRIVPTPSPWDKHGQTILGHAMEGIAKDIESRLRSRLDTGIDLGGALKAQAVTVRNADGRLHITTKKPVADEFLDLFKSSASAPHVENNKLIFRQIREEQLGLRNLQAVRSSVEDTMRLSLKQHLDNAIRRVIAENPELG